jgi:hypothetical protein
MNGLKLTQDEIVERLFLEPSKVSESRLYLGWLGKTDVQGRWRLYSDLLFSEYFEFDESDALNMQRFGPEVSPFGGTAIWLKRSAKVTRTRLTQRQAQASLLRGRITKDHIDRALPSFTSGEIDPAATTPTTVILTILVTATIIVIVSATTDQECPNPANSGALCPTNLSHCC